MNVEGVKENQLIILFGANKTIKKEGGSGIVESNKCNTNRRVE